MQIDPTRKKLHVIKEYSALDIDLREKIKMRYPYGLEKNFIRYTDKDEIYVNAILFETEDKKYLIRISNSQARNIDRSEDITLDFDKSILKTDQDIMED